MKPSIVEEKIEKVSPWVELVARRVTFEPGAENHLYHSVRSADYVHVLAVTGEGKIPLVRQYRPAINDFSLELPAGLVDPGELPFKTAARELEEETGLRAIEVVPIGVFPTEPGRLTNKTHSFFVRAGEQLPNFSCEPGLELFFVDRQELVNLIGQGRFGVQGHLGTIMLAVLAGHFNLAPASPPE